ncbi:hypothetical protein [Kitasatospora sp. KL5]|uniref:hypothetical protein n=1 Tax=Kitasatospora sp. KL5 TaxID=3425125 RepID=UPI003D6F5110
MSDTYGGNPWQYTYDQPPPAPRSRWRRGWIPVAALLGLVLAVVAGVLVWRSAEPDVPAANRAPFYRAVQNLFGEPVVHYTGTASGGSPGWDVKVTGDGAMSGTVTSDGERIDVLAVEGRTYVKPPKSLLTGLPDGASGSSLEGKWVTGSDRLARPLPQGLVSPAELAGRLWAALDEADFPPPGAPTTRVGDRKAVAVRTSEGVLFVSADAPYRVLRLAPATAAGAGAPAGAARVADRAAAAPAAFRAGAPAAVGKAAALGPVDFEPMSPADVGRAYDELIDRTKALGSAVDLGVDFTFNQTGNLSCSQSCTVTENVVTRTTAKPGVKVSGTVTAVMNADVTVNGRGAGGCSQTATLPVNGSGTISCVAAGTAPVVEQIRAEKQREADQQARATGRSVNLQYTLDFRARVRITAQAVAQAELERTVRAQQSGRDSAVKNAERRAGCAGGGTVSGAALRTGGPAAVPAADTPAPGKECTTTVYRVQTDHPDSKRLGVDKDGNITRQGNGNLYLNMSGDIAHSQTFRGGSGQIIAFEVPTSRVERILDAALPQRMPRGYTGSRREWNQARKNAPEIADPKLSPGLIGLPQHLLDEFLDSIVPGSGRIVR